MKYDNRKAFEKHFQETASDQLAKVYLMTSKDEEECQDVVQLIIRSLIGKQHPELAVRVFIGTQAPISEIVEELATPSFFAPQRVFWIQQFDKLKKGAFETLEKFLRRLPHSHFVILTAAAYSKTQSLYKFIEQDGVILELPEIKPWEKEKQLVDWLNQQITQHRKIMPYPVCQQMVKQIGLEQTLLQRELDKLLCFVGDKKEISLQDIQTICTCTFHETVWQLGEAIFRRDALNALRIGRSFLEEGQALLPLLRQIRSQFQTDYQVCLLWMQGKQADIAKDFPYMRGQILERHLQLAQQYGAERFKEGLLAIDAVEIQTKNVQIDDGILLDLLIAKLTF